MPRILHRDEYIIKQEFIAYLNQLGDKFISINNWQEDRFNKMKTQLYRDLAMKEEALKNIQVLNIRCY